MSEKKDCSCDKKATKTAGKVSDILHSIPTEAKTEKQETAAEKTDKYAIGIFRPINNQPLSQVKDILRDDFIINIINYFDTPKKIVEARMTIQKLRKTTYPEYQILGLVTVDKFDNAPVVFDLSKKFGYLFRNMDFSYINKDGEQTAVSKIVSYAIRKIVCKKLQNKLRRIQIDYLTKNAKILNNNEPSYYRASFKEVLGTSIGTTIDNVIQTLDPKKSTKGLKKFIKDPKLLYFEPLNPYVFDNININEPNNKSTCKYPFYKTWCRNCTPNNNWCDDCN
jgi:6-pyruvoyl-tetrahydropterin synthase